MDQFFKSKEVVKDMTRVRSIWIEVGKRKFMWHEKGEMELIKSWISVGMPKLEEEKEVDMLRNLFLNLLTTRHSAEMLVEKVMDSQKDLYPVRLV